MRGPLLALSLAAFALGWLILFGAGIRIADWDAALLLLGATALFYWTFRTGQIPPRLPKWQAAALWALPVYAIFQLIPLPPVLLQLLSPARAVMASSLGGVLPAVSAAPISVVPSAALSGLFGLLSYLTIFSLLRDIGWRFVESHPWVPVVPIAAIASIEGLIGIGQWLGGGHSGALVTGTFSNGEHFAGLLEIALPFTLVFGFISFRRHQSQESVSQKPAALAAGSWTASLVLLLALAQSSSATSGAVVVSSVLVLLGLTVVPRLQTRKLRWYGFAIAAVGAVSAVVFLSPPATSTAINSGSLLGAFRWFGTGTGGFAPTFLKYQESAYLTRISNPGNDVLTLLITFGIAGFSIVLVALAGILRPAILGAVFLTDEPRRLLAAALSASLAGMLLSSGLEATLSVPAIAMAFAWVAGLSQSSGLE